MSVVLSPIWLKFWPKVCLASLLNFYFMKRSDYILKNGVLVAFPVLGETGINKVICQYFKIKIAKKQGEFAATRLT